MFSSKKEKEACIGIDLGTSTSCVAAYHNGKVEIIPNEHGNRAMPSYVAFTRTARLIGDAAKNQLSSNPDNTMFNVKRLIGRAYSDQSVVNDIKHWSFSVIRNSDDKPCIEISDFKDGRERFTPEEISAMVLTKMKETAEAYLGCHVTSAVITVPAHFNDAQRQATKDAGAIAGLNVLRIMNEPTAAAIAYGLDKISTSDGAYNILVFDLGGGTLDVSVLNMDENIFEVKSTAGNTCLGGEDFDNRLVSYVLEDVKRRYKIDLGNNKRALCRLRTACERAKCVLSVNTKATIDIDAFFDGIDYYTEITRNDFDELCADHFCATLESVTKALCDAKLDKSEIKEVVLVGGSTRIPKVQKLLSEFFNGKSLNKTINPDEAVAYGAAVQAAVLSGAAEYDSKLNNYLLIDVAPFSLGLETDDAAFTVLIPRGMSIPCKQCQTFSTTSDNQEAFTVRVFEGEQLTTAGNHLLGTFELTGIAPAPRGVPKINVTFDMDCNGFVNVSAADTKSGNSQNITVISSSQGRLSKDEIARMTKEAAKFKAEDERFKKALQAKIDLETFVLTAKDVIDNMTEIMHEDDYSRLLSKISKTIGWIEDNDSATKEEYEERLHQFKKMYASALQLK